MKIFGSATLIASSGSRSTPSFRFSAVEAELVAGGLDEAGEQGDGGDDGRADGEALGDGLRGVADGVEADHDPLRARRGTRRDISAMPAALSDTGPNVSSDTITPVVASMPMPHSATR